ncbi:hypothetical protein CWI36_0324p0010 [Hamiltosporidium magnivora]|uniref:Uncharacterized protein n=1 Tax=Hamiltosporidium magnivora TaxID=148818 RepID=A0A4Q9LJ92_9MICR|nr:hypothetical protein CWI36_0324p0010 [Hamiltosporidium magnivora]
MRQCFNNRHDLAKDKDFLVQTASRQYINSFTPNCTRYTRKGIKIICGTDFRNEIKYVFELEHGSFKYK